MCINRTICINTVYLPAAFRQRQRQRRSSVTSIEFIASQFCAYRNTDEKRHIVSQIQTYRLKSNVNSILAIVFFFCLYSDSISHLPAKSFQVCLFTCEWQPEPEAIHFKNKNDLLMEILECDAECETKLITNGWIGINKPKTSSSSSLS